MHSLLLNRHREEAAPFRQDLHEVPDEPEVREPWGCRQVDEGGLLDVEAAVEAAVNVPPDLEEL